MLVLPELTFTTFTLFVIFVIFVIFVVENIYLESYSSNGISNSRKIRVHSRLKNYLINTNSRTQEKGQAVKLGLSGLGLLAKLLRLANRHEDRDGKNAACSHSRFVQRADSAPGIVLNTLVTKLERRQQQANRS